MFTNFTIICFQLSASAGINRLLKNRNILEIEIMAKITNVLVNLRLCISNNYDYVVVIRDYLVLN